MDNTARNLPAHLDLDALDTVCGGMMMAALWDWDYAAYGAAFVGGVAGHFAGGGSFNDVPWVEIDKASREGPVR